MSYQLHPERPTTDQPQPSSPSSNQQDSRQSLLIGNTSTTPSHYRIKTPSRSPISTRTTSPPPTNNPPPPPNPPLQNGKLPPPQPHLRRLLRHPLHLPPHNAPPKHALRTTRLPHHRPQHLKTRRPECVCGSGELYAGTGDRGAD